MLAFIFSFFLVLASFTQMVLTIQRTAIKERCFHEFVKDITKLRHCGRLLAWKKNMDSALIWLSKNQLLTPHQFIQGSQWITSKANLRSCHSLKATITLFNQDDAPNWWPNWIYYLSPSEDRYGNTMVFFRSHSPSKEFFCGV